MKKIQSIVVCTLFLAASTGVTAAPLVSTTADREGIAITVYNSNLGLIKDRRNIEVPRGVSELRFMDVAAQIIPASVQITAFGNTLLVLEQNYEYDLLNPQKLLDKYVGKEVRLFQKNAYTEREEEVKATLLSNNGSPIYRIGKDITFSHPGRVIFPEVPVDLIATPTLVWLLEGGEAAGRRQVEATYLTSGISWKADYVLTLGKDSSLADLAGWVTIDNRSGATYGNAKLKLVAGDVNRVREEQPRGRMYKADMAMMAAAPQFKEEGLFEYHLYTLQRPSTLKDNQTKQISLLTASSVPVRREIVVRAEQGWYGAPHGGEALMKQKVGVFVEFENRETNNLGLPLPKGTIRVYQQDSDGTLQFIGEDSVAHTPKDENVRVKVGDAFDITAIRRQMDWKKLASDTYEAAWEVVIRNHKSEDVVVKVLEPMTGDWKVVDSSSPPSKRDSQTAEFNVQVKKDGEAKLTYRVRVRY